MFDGGPIGRPVGSAGRALQTGGAMNEEGDMRKIIAAVLIVAAGVGMGGTAFAGEVGGSANGHGPKGTSHANSICVFSGLEDGSEDPTGPSGPGTAQNWGQIPK